jgi:hypothetical protein
MADLHSRAYHTDVGVMYLALDCVLQLALRKPAAIAEISANPNLPAAR